MGARRHPVNGYLLDTNILSEFTRPQPDAHVVAWLRAVDRTQVFLSVMTIAELRKGVELLRPSKRRSALEQWLDRDILHYFGTNLLPVDLLIADRWARFQAGRHRAGRPLHAIDGLLAATAHEHQLTLVTRNTGDFQGLGITVLDPFLHP